MPSPGRCLLPDFSLIIDDEDGRCCWMTAGPDCDSHRYFGLMMIMMMVMMMIGCMHYHIRCHHCSYVFWIDYEQSFAIRKKVYGDEHSTIAASLNNVGTVLSLSGKKDEALV